MILELLTRSQRESAYLLQFLGTEVANKSTSRFCLFQNGGFSYKCICTQRAPFGANPEGNKRNKSSSWSANADRLFFSFGSRLNRQQMVEASVIMCDRICCASTHQNQEGRGCGVKEKDFALNASWLVECPYGAPACLPEAFDVTGNSVAGCTCV